MHAQGRPRRPRPQGSPAIDDGEHEEQHDLTLDQRELTRLRARLGSGNREFLVALALAFPSTTTFTLDDASIHLRTSKGTLRARIMNIGRSLKSLGNDFTVLWDTEWTLLGENQYRWREDRPTWALGLLVYAAFRIIKGLGE